MNRRLNMAVIALCLALTAGACTRSETSEVEEVPQPIYDTGHFFSTLDRDNDGFISRQEWGGMGLTEMSFPLCDANGDGMISRQEMAGCAIPAEMDTEKEGMLTVYAQGRFVIPSPGAPIPTPAKAPPGITQATQFVADSPYVEGGPTGEDFIRLFDTDGDGRISHMEWESKKNDTVFQPFRWPQYNQNRDEWITLDEAPQPPAE
jgi:hypothetical protein